MVQKEALSLCEMRPFLCPINLNFFSISQEDSHVQNLVKEVFK